jgi:hypothetical protein
MGSRSNKESREMQERERKRRSGSIRPPAVNEHGRLRTRKEMIDAVVEEAETGRPKKR